MSRWYDNYEKLGQQLEKLKDMESRKRDTLIKGLMTLIKEQSPELLEDVMIEFSLKIQRRRWYDNDPNLGLLINGLQNGKDELLHQVAEYLEEKS